MSDENETSSSPFGTWWWLSAGFLVLLAIIATVVFVTASGDSDEPITQPTSSGSPTSSVGTTPPGATDGACDLPTADQDIPVTGPEAEWVAVEYLLTPTSPDYGPVDRPGSAWPCFAHSPTGALFAAVHFTVAMSGPDYEELAPEAALQNAALDVWLADENPETHVQTAGRVAQFAGFRFVELSPADQLAPDRVVIDVGLRQSQVEGFFRVAMVWDEEAGTWKGDMSATRFEPEVAEMSDFTRWSAGDE